MTADVIPNQRTVEAIRFGFGLGRTKAARVDPPSQAAFEAAQTSFREFAKVRRNNQSLSRRELRKIRAPFDEMRARYVRAEFARALAPEDDFEERLVWFWTDHFNVSYRQPNGHLLVHRFQEEVIRPNLQGRFEEMLLAATRHPAMLLYLDQASSAGPNSRAARQNSERGLNENLAREVLELHSLGVNAGYTQKDVREFAKLLTGLSIKAPVLSFQFRANLVEPGLKEVLGRRFGSNDLRDQSAIEDGLRFLANHPQTARHLARKLVTHFFTDTPDADTIFFLAGLFETTGGDLRRIHNALRQHPDARTTFGQKAKQPFEFVISSLRATGITPRDLDRLNNQDFAQRIVHPLSQMGQKFREAPGPDGWPEEPSVWINPIALAARITWVRELTSTFKMESIEPLEFLDQALGDYTSEALIWAAPRAETRKQAMALILTSPEFNRR